MDLKLILKVTHTLGLLEEYNNWCKKMRQPILTFLLAQWIVKSLNIKNKNNYKKIGGKAS